MVCWCCNVNTPIMCGEMLHKLHYDIKLFDADNMAMSTTNMIDTCLAFEPCHRTYTLCNAG